MKKLVAVMIAAGLLGTGTANAQSSASGQFNVNVTLTSSCTLSAINDLAFSYTSFQSGTANATGGGYSVSCTNSLPYTFGLQSGTGTATPPGASTISVTDNAVNLAYQLALSAAGGTGNGSAQTYSVTGTMAGNQAGTCSGASCSNSAATNKRHTLIVNY